MNVAYVCADPGVPTMGRKGCSIHVRAIMNAFIERGHNVSLICSRLGGEIPASLADAHCAVAKPTLAQTEVSRFQAGLANDRAVTELLSITSAERGPFDLLYIRHALWSFEPLAWAKHAGIPSVLEVNAPLVDEQARYRTLTHRSDAHRIERKAMNLADVVVGVSSGVANAIAPMMDHVERICIVHNGVDTTALTPNATPHQTDPSRVTIGFVGTLKPWHGLDTLIDALSLIAAERSHVRLLVVGDGPERDRLDERVRTLGLEDSLHFTGPVDSDQIPGWLTSMDIAVAPYPDIDGFYFSPLKLFEYMAAGCACVTTRVGDLSGLIDHGHTGLLCPPDDTKALAETITRLVDDAALRAELGARARQRAVQDHEWSAVLDRILSEVPFAHAAEKSVSESVH
jgi:glycosyltransferase involved in cell wall biosynthesis